MRGEDGDVGQADRVGIYASCDQAGGVGDVCHEKSIHFIGDFSQAQPVRGPRVGGKTSHDHPGAVFPGQCHDAVIVQSLRGVVHTIGDDPVPPAREVERAAVGQVPSLEQVHPHQCVARLQKGVVHCQVGGRSREGLHIDINPVCGHLWCDEELGAAPLGQRLNEIDVGRSLVEAAVGVAPVVGQLMVEVQEQRLVVVCHSGGRVSLGIDVVED